MLAALSREEALRRSGCTIGDAPVRHADARSQSSSRRRRGRSACTSAARPCTSACTSGTRARSSSGCGCGSWLRGPATRSRSSTTSLTSTTRSTPRPRSAGVGSRELAERATEWFFEDTDDLGLGRPDVEPRATETIPEIVAFIEELVARDRAYEAQRRRVLPGGARRRLRPPVGRAARGHGRAGAERAEGRPARLRALEGAEAARGRSLGLAVGPGRPGWHIECSAMAEKHLGPEFEIHGGGLDLRFPHHENELAQSSALGHPFAQIWMHNGMLELDAEKMSKSLGNVVTLRNVLDTWGRETLLVFHLTGHWRKPVDFSDEALEQAAAAARRRSATSSALPSEPAADGAWERFAAALDDDFSTPAALAVMHEWRDHGLLRTRPRRVRARVARRARTRRRDEVVALAEQREAARARSDFDDGRPAARRDRGRSAGRCGTMPGGFRLVRRRRSDARARLRPARRCARRSAAGERCSSSRRPSGPRRRPWLDSGADAPQVEARADLTELAGTRDHQGVVALVRALQLRRRVRARAAAAAAARLPRPGHRSAQPRGRRAERRGGGSDRRRPACPPLCPRDAGRLPRVRRCRRASAGRRRPEPRAVPRGREGQ